MVKYCSNCGSPADDQAAFCGSCGTSFSGAGGRPGYQGAPSQVSVFGSAPTLILIALILAIVGAIGWLIGGILFVLDEDLFAIYAFVAVGVLVWTIVRTSAIRAAMEQGDAQTAARLTTVPFGIIVTIFGNVISGILVLISIGSITTAAAGQPRYQAPAPGPSTPPPAHQPPPPAPGGPNESDSAEVSASSAAGTVDCSNCGASNPEGNAFCHDCGTKLA